MLYYVQKLTNDLFRILKIKSPSCLVNIKFIINEYFTPQNQKDLDAPDKYINNVH